MLVSKISKKGQVVIPKEIREKLGFQPGDVLIFRISNGEVIIEKIQESMAEILQNSPSLKEDSKTFQRKLRSEWD